MKDRDQCLIMIQKIREVAVGEEVAYVARSRIGRLLLNLRKLIGRLASITVPDRPISLNVPLTIERPVRDLVVLCNRINEDSRMLVQPSEPLDQRWKSGWAVFNTDLDLLEQLLRKL